MSRLDLRGTVDQLAAAREQQDRVEVAADARLKQLLDARPDQIDAWVDATVTNLEGVRTVLKLVVRVVVIVARRELRG